MGQVVGAVLAESAAIAEKAAKLVTVRYEDLPTIMTIEDAIAADRYLSTPSVLRTLPRFVWEGVNTRATQSLPFFFFFSHAILSDKV